MAGILTTKTKHMSAIKWNATIPLPKNSGYKTRITGASFGPAKSSGNPMITLEHEIAGPETVMVGDKEVSILGVKLKKTYHTTKVLDGTAIVEDETKKKRELVFGTSDQENPSLWARLGLDGSLEDAENPNVKQLVGKICLSQCSSEEDADREDPTFAELEAARKAGIHASKAGKIITNPMNGKKKMKYWPMIDEIFGVAPSSGY